METEDRVLLIEDSKSFAAILQRLISSSHGYTVDLAEDLASTQKILEKGDNQYFAAIVDYHLPDGPEGEAIDVVVKHNIPAIVFTGSGKALEEDMWAKGIADYASKTGAHNLDYVSWMVKRIFLNRKVEILIVDDSRTSCNHIKSLLYRQKFIVHTANSGEEALEKIKANQSICIAVVDCYMAGMTGFELCKKLRELYSRANLEIVGVSSDNNRKTAAQFIKSGASEFVPKPLIPEEFLCRINNAADRIESYMELDKLNKIKNQFLGAAAHDIRGPLGAIKTAADFLIKRSPSPERTEVLLNMIQNSSVELLKLLETLLDVSSIESGNMALEFRQVDIGKCLQERVDLYHAEAHLKDIEIKTEIENDISIKVDQIKITQVFDNLITNAIKYSLPKSEVNISLSQESELVKIAVQDAGPGISQDEQKQLFKAFSVLSTKATGNEKKTGLGLAIAKSIVDAHKGKIYYCHSEDLHSTFFVQIPIKA